MTGTRTTPAPGTALVTGAASGIGLAIARQPAAEGHAVHLVDIVPRDDLAAELGGRPHRQLVRTAVGGDALGVGGSAGSEPARCRRRVVGVVTFPGGGAHAASKHALVAVSEQTVLALQDTDISVMVLCPALVRSGTSDIGSDPTAISNVPTGSPMGITRGC